jgi:hypothetical protein
MTPDKLQSLCSLYLAKLDGLCPDIKPRQMSDDQSKMVAHLLTSSTRVAHYKFMCVQASAFVEDGQREKAMRWLGFLQGVLWRRNLFTLAELKEQASS